MLAHLFELEDFDASLETLSETLDSFESALKSVRTSGTQWTSNQHIVDIAFHLIYFSWCISRNLPQIKASLPKTTYTKRLKTTQLICARSWSIFYYFCVDSDLVDDTKVPFILSWAHRHLGQSGLCSSDNGSFLKIIVNHMIPLPDWSSEVFQCYKCLYGTVVKITSDQMVEEHSNTSPVPFGKDPAAELLTMIRPFLMEKIESGSYRTISNDIRQCLDRVSDAFPEPPMDHRKLF